MRRDEVFERWAPTGASWSDWVKPVLFSNLADPAGPGKPPPRPRITPEFFAPPPDDGEHPYRAAPPQEVAVVVELPGPSSVGAGLALATLGFQPVPLYNSLPGSLVDVVPVARALVAGADELSPPRSGAPPAFLLDSSRLGEGRRVRVGDYDNRALCSFADFPSADRLRAAGVQRVVLWSAERPLWDLALVLRRFRDAGLSVLATRGDDPPQPLKLGPAWLGRLRFFLMDPHIGIGYVPSSAGG